MVRPGSLPVGRSAGALGRLDALGRGAVTTDGGLRRSFVLKAVAVGYVVFCATYLAINEFSVGRPAHILYLPGEERLPFVPEFEFLYMTGYLFPLLVIWKVTEVATFVRLTGAFALTLVVAYTTYLLFPVYLERPHLEIDSVATFLLSLEYLDHSYNHFPSLHVAIGWLVYLACREALRRPATLFLALSGMSVATLFVKQHYVVDVAFGALLALAAWTVAGRWIAKRALPSGHPASSGHPAPPGPPASPARPAPDPTGA